MFLEERVVSHALVGYPESMPFGQARHCVAREVPKRIDKKSINCNRSTRDILSVEKGHGLTINIPQYNDI
jgi:hypothetical protein